MADSWIDNMAYKPIQYQQINPVSIENIAKTYTTLAEMHTKSVEVKTKLAESIAAMPFNEQDEWYRQSVLDFFNNEISNMRAICSGDLAGDYERILRLSEELTSSKEFRGRLAANKKYQEFIDKVDKDAELSNVEKEFYKKANPYMYDNTTKDELGRDVMFEWNPNYDIIHLPSMDEILKRAKTNIAIRYYGDSHPLDLPFHQGQVNVPGFVGQQFITKDMLLTGMIDIIASDPKIKEGFQRKYDIGVWHDLAHAGDEWEMKTNRQIPIDKATGMIMDYDRWLSGLLEPFASGAETYMGYSPGQLNSLRLASGKGNGNTSGTVKKTDEQKQKEKDEKTKTKNRTDYNVVDPSKQSTKSDKPKGSSTSRKVKQR
jgi:hypothetical protein